MKLIYKEEEINLLLSMVNSLELAPGKNIANAQRVSKIFDVLNAAERLDDEDRGN